MNVRQRGVAHVNIVWALVPTILFIGAAAVAYFNAAEGTKKDQRISDLSREKREEVAKTEARAEQLREISKHIGCLGSFQPSQTESGVPQPAVSTFTEPKALAAKVEEIRKAIGQSGDTVEALVDPIKRAMTTSTESVKTANGERDAANGQRQAEIDAHTKTRTEKDAAIATLSNAKTEADDALVRQTRDMQGQIARAQDGIRKANDDLKKANDASAQEQSKLRKDMAVLNARISAQAEVGRMQNAPDEPDGKVIGSSDAVNLAWIDIGRRQMLRPGTAFRIFEKTRAGNQLKGHGIVKNVEEYRSELQITDLVSALNPVVKGDLVANDLYTPGVGRKIYLLGRYVYPNTKDEVKRLLSELGNTVVDKIDPTVNLVLIGRDEFAEGGITQPIAETQEYKDALNLGIEITSIDKVRDLLKR